METTKELQSAKTPLTIKSILEKDEVKEKLHKMLGKKTQGFITSVLQIVSSSEILKKCNPMSIYHCAMTAAALDLPINNTIGQAYIVPFGNNATLIIGYKGLCNLATRTGQYKRLDAFPVYDGQLIAEDPKYGHKFDWSKKSDKIIGYYAFYLLTSGLERELYMTTAEMQSHAKKYSKTYGNKNGAWATNETEMSQKTVLRLLLSSGAPMAIEYIGAIEHDEFIPDNLPADDIQAAEYVQPINEIEELNKKIAACNNIEDLAVLRMSINPNLYQAQIDAIDAKIESINSSNNGRS